MDEIDAQLTVKNKLIEQALTDLSSIEGDSRIESSHSRWKIEERTSVRSPVDGVVNRINYVTADAYISTGEVLLEIVPTGSDLIVETK